MTAVVVRGNKRKFALPLDDFSQIQKDIVDLNLGAPGSLLAYHWSGTRVVVSSWPTFDALKALVAEHQVSEVEVCVAPQLSLKMGRGNSFRKPIKGISRNFEKLTALRESLRRPTSSPGTAVERTGVTSRSQTQARNTTRATLSVQRIATGVSGEEQKLQSLPPTLDAAKRLFSEIFSPEPVRTIGYRLSSGGVLIDVEDDEDYKLLSELVAAAETRGTALPIVTCTIDDEPARLKKTKIIAGIPKHRAALD